jgi:hypothetical protein
MTYAFLYDYDGERNPIDAKGCVYQGSPGFNKPVDFIIAEPPISSFEDSGGEELSWLFNIAESYDTVDRIIMSLPIEFVEGMAKGYVIELSEYLEDKGFFSTQMLKVNHTYFGSAIEGESVFIICGKEPTPIPVSINTVVTKASSVLSDIITHAPYNPDNIAFSGGAGTMHGFVRSNANSFPPIESWGSEYLMVERRYEDTLRIGRLTVDEIATLFGVGIEPHIPMEKVSKIVPTIVYGNFLRTFILK